MKFTHALLLSALGWLAGSPATAQADDTDKYPQRVVRIVVPTPAGGASDTAARLLAQALGPLWGQQVIVENKPGAGGAIAVQSVLAAPADGHTLLWGLSSLAGLPLAQANAPFKHLGELAPVAPVLEFGYALFATPSLPVHSVAELVAYGRQHPGQLHYATGTLGEFMVGAQVLKAAGVTAVRVPYKGGAQLVPDLMSGVVQLNVGPIANGHGHAKAGKLKALATLTAQRSPLLPGVPTLAEAGVALPALPSWNALFAPPQTPRALTTRMARDVSQALKAPALRAALDQQGATVLGGTPEQLQQAVDKATEVWKQFAREHDIANE